MDWLANLSAIGPWLGGFLGGGLVASIATSYYTAKIEREKDLTKERRALIALWREEILKDFDNTVRMGSAERRDRYPFMDKPSWHRLRPHLSAKLISQLESRYVTAIAGTTRKFPRDWISDEIAALEKKWGLI